MLRDFPYLIFLMLAAACVRSTPRLQPTIAASPMPEVRTVLRPAVISAATELVNPLRGLFNWIFNEPLYTPDPRTRDNYERNTLSWRALEPTKDHYDFTPIDRLVEAAAAQGRRFSFRVICLVPDFGDFPIAVPDYLRAEMPLGFEYTDNRGIDVYVPDWNDSDFVERATKLIRELGKRYDADPRIAFIDIGFLGTFAEWYYFGLYPHGVVRPAGCGGFPETVPKYLCEPLYEDTKGQSVSGARAPTFSTKKAIIDAHVAAFPRTRKVMMIADREALVYAFELSDQIGWRNDGLGNINFERMVAFFEQVPGDNDSRKSPEELEQERKLALLLPERWKTALVVAEYNDANRADGTLQRATDQIRRYHVSLVANNWGNDDVTEEEKQTIVGNGRLAGYRFRLVSVELPMPLPRGRRIDLDFEWANEGIAPAYEAYSAKLVAKDSLDRIVLEIPLAVDFRSMLPGTLRSHETFSLPPTTPSGTYRLFIEVAGTLSLQLANQKEIAWVNIE